MNLTEDCGFIYIMTNPAFPKYVKIGYATDPEKRRKDLSHASGVPLDFEIYATYAVPIKIADKKVHALIMTLNPSLRLNKNKEFFVMEAESAFKLLEAVAAIHGRLNKLFRYVDGVPVPIAQDSDENGIDDSDDEAIIQVEPKVDSVQLNSAVLLKGGKPATPYLKEVLSALGLIDSSWKVTHAKLNKDGKRFWANPNSQIINENWCLVLNNMNQKKLYIFKIPKNTFKPSQLKTRLHKTGNNSAVEELDVEIVKQDNMFVCIASKVNYTTWFVKEIDY